jgi:hypothetical protein
MADFLDSFLPALDQLRGVAGILGYRQIAVTVRVVTWTGNIPGKGTSSFVDTPITVMSGAQNPRVTQVTERDVIASGGLYSTQDVKVGPFTPPFGATFFIAAGGVSQTTTDPSQTVPASSGFKEIHYALTGKGYPNKAWFERVGSDNVSPTRWIVYLRKSGIQQPGGAP